MAVTAEGLKKMSKEEVLQYIRERLRFKDYVEHLRYVDKDAAEKEHRRFEMSGYDGEVGDCTTQNMGIVNEFADLGIYNYTAYLFLDFYKGSGTLYMRYFYGDENIEHDVTNMGTTEIIYKIFEETIFSGHDKRRRF